MIKRMKKEAGKRAPTAGKQASITGVVELRSNLPHVLREVEFRGERFVIQNNGRGVAALVSLDDLAKLELMERVRVVAEMVPPRLK